MNLNHHVLVKWTEEGLVHLENLHRAALGNLADKYPHTDADCDADGWTRIQLWRLMQILGPTLHIGIAKPLIEGNEVRIPEEGSP